jgi:hypothetical protein
MEMRFQAAPVGAISLVAICLTAICFPAAGLLTGPGHHVAGELLATCGFTFTPAITCSVYSIAKERLKSFGSVGLVIAAVTVWLERETLYFIEMGLFLVPCTLLVMMVISKRRARAREGASTR